MKVSALQSLSCFLCLTAAQRMVDLPPVEPPKQPELPIYHSDLSSVLDPRNGGSPSNPGVKLRLSDKGLKYVNQVAGNLLNEEIRNAKIPDVSKSFGKGSVKAHNIRITSFSSPAYNYRLISPNRLEWSLQNGDISLSGRWSGKYKQWITIRGSGGVSATAKDVRVALSAAMRKNSQGKPIFTDVKCFATIRINLSIDGGVIGWIMNIFSGYIEGELEPVLEDEICKMAKKFVSGDVNVKLDTLPAEIKSTPTAGVTILQKDFNLDYRLTQDPEVGYDYVETSNRGEIRYRMASSTPFYPHPIQQSNSNSKMLYFWASDYVLNSLLHHAHQNNISKFLIDEDSLPHLGSYLQPSCPSFQLCLGTLFPEIEEAFPDVKAEVFATTTTDPVAVIGEGNATVSGSGILEVFVKHAGRRFRLLKATLKGIADLIAKLKDTDTNEPKLTAEATITSIIVERVESDYLKLQDMQMYAEFTRPLVQDQVNQFLSKGIRLLVTKNAHLHNVQVNLKPRTLEIGADVDYTG